MPVRMLVTGATGMVGSELVRRFTSVGLKVRASVHGSEPKPQLFNSDLVEAVPFDFTDKSSVENALEGISEVFLMTPEVPEQAEYVRIFLEQAQKSRVNHVLLMSFLGTDRVPMIRTARWHHESELYLSESGIPYTVIRPNLFMQNFITRYQPSGGLVYLPVGKGKISYVDTRDVAFMAAEIMVTSQQHLSKIYRATGTQSLSLKQACTIISEVIGSHVQFADISEETARHILESSGMAAWQVESTIELYALQRNGLLEEINSDFESVTGAAQTSFIDFVRDYAETLRVLVEHEEE